MADKDRESFGKPRLNLLLDRKSPPGAEASLCSSSPSRLGEITIPSDAVFLESEDLDYEDALVRRLASAKASLAPREIGVNLALDAACTGGGSVSRGYRGRFARFIEKIIDLDIGLMLSEPMLISFAAGEFGALRIIAYAKSSHGILDFHLRARFFERVFGISGNLTRIVIPSDLNRDFRAIEAIRVEVSGELGIVVNEGDVLYNPFTISEQCALSHLSSFRDPSRFEEVERVFRANREACFRRDTWRLLASPWVRPQDLHYYEDLGISSFMVLAPADRDRSMKMIEAYGARSYQGNLLRILRYGGPLADSIHLASAGLEGFIPRIKDAGGCTDSCADCRICEETQAKTVRMVENE